MKTKLIVQEIIVSLTKETEHALCTQPHFDGYKGKHRLWGQAKAIFTEPG